MLSLDKFSRHLKEQLLQRFNNLGVFAFINTPLPFMCSSPFFVKVLQTFFFQSFSNVFLFFDAFFTYFTGDFSALDSSLDEVLKYSTSL